MVLSEEGDCFVDQEELRGRRCQGECGLLFLNRQNRWCEAEALSEPELEKCDFFGKPPATIPNGEGIGAQDASAEWSNQTSSPRDSLLCYSGATGFGLQQRIEAAAVPCK